MSNKSPFVFYKRFATYFEAHVFIQHLESKDIPFIIKNEAMGTMMPQVLGGVEIWIKQENKEEVEALMLIIEENNELMSETLGFEEDVSGLNPENRICTHCGSKNTRIFENEEDYSLYHKIFKKKQSASTAWYCFHCRKKF